MDSLLNNFNNWRKGLNPLYYLVVTILLCPVVFIIRFLIVVGVFSGGLALLLILSFFGYISLGLYSFLVWYYLLVGFSIYTYEN